MTVYSDLDIIPNITSYVSILCLVLVCIVDVIALQEML